MSNQLNKPTEGTSNWHEPLNENFEAIEEKFDWIDTQLEQRNAEGDGEPGDTPADRYVVERTSGNYEALRDNGTVVEFGSDGQAVLQAAIDDCPTDGRVDVRGNYSFGSTPVKITKDLRLYGYNARIDHRVSRGAFEIEGNYVTSTKLNRSSAAGDESITVTDASGIKPGQIILFESDDRICHPDDQTAFAGEGHFVHVVDGNKVTLEDTIQWDHGYDLSEMDVDVYIYDPITVQMKGFKIVADTSSDYAAVTARATSMSLFADMQIDLHGDWGIRIENSGGATIRDCLIKRGGLASTAYGIQIWAGCFDCTVESCLVKSNRHSFTCTIGGGKYAMPSRGTLVTGCSFSTSIGACVDTHGGSAIDITYDNCMFHTHGQRGVLVGAFHTYIQNCKFYVTSNAIHDRNDQLYPMNLYVTNCYARDVGRFVRTQQTTSGVKSYDNFEVRNCKVDRCRYFVDVADPIRQLAVTGNQVNRCTDSRNLFFRNEIGESAIIANNQIIGGEDRCIYFNGGATGVIVTGNVIKDINGGGRVIDMNTNVTRSLISNNLFIMNQGVTIYRDRGESNYNICRDNVIHMPNASSSTIDVASGSRSRNNDLLDTNTNEWTTT